jgi:hypothetical protein
MREVGTRRADGWWVLRCSAKLSCQHTSGRGVQEHVFNTSDHHTAGLELGVLFQTRSQV